MVIGRLRISYRLVIRSVQWLPADLELMDKIERTIREE